MKRKILSLSLPLSSPLHSAAFKKFFMSYSLLLFILLSVFTAVYLKTSYDQEYARLTQYYDSDIHRIGAAVDVEISGLINLKNNIRHTTWVKKLMTSADTFNSEFDTLAKINCQDELMRYVALNNLVSDLAIIIPQKNLAVTPSGWFTIEEYKTYLKGKRIYDTEDIFKRLSSAATLDSLTQIKGNTARGNSNILCLQSLDDTQSPMASLLLIVDKVRLTSIIKSLSYDGGQGFQMLTDDGKPLAELNIEAIKSESTTALLESDYINASYISFNKPLLAQVLENKVMLFQIGLILIGALFLALMLSYLLSLLSYRPLEKLIAAISRINGKEKAEYKPEYDFIKQSFEAMYGQNVSMGQKVERYYKAAKNNMLIKLLRGYFESGQVERQLSEYSLPFTEDKNYVVMVLDSVNGEYELRHCEEVEIITRLGTFFSSLELDFEVIEAVEHHIVVIIPFDDASAVKTDFLDIAYQLKSRLIKETEIPLNVSVGQPYKGIIGISKSYQELQGSLKSIQNIYCDDVFQSQRDSDSYYYPLDWEIQLINSMKGGNSLLSRKIMEEIIFENSRRNLSSAVSFKLMSILIETVKRVVFEQKIEFESIEDQIFKIYHFQNEPAAAWEALCELTLQVSETVAAKDSHEASSVGNDIIRYVKSNYHESTMSLKELSEKFSLPTYAVSKVFKENSGVNFYEYLSALRMEKAKEIFDTVGYDIAYVSKAVGYESEYSFRRAFLKYENMKPREYVEKKQITGE